MFDNPFSPVFGRKPNLFFGRKHILRRFERALRDEGSEDCALFVTGTRGSGKTALIEQLSLLAKRRGWHVIDLGPEDTVRTLARRLAGHDEETRTIDPQLSVGILGSGGSVGGVSTARTTRVERGDLDVLLVKACLNSSKGVMVTVDEIQKLSESDVSAISNAFQMASRKGMNSILVTAGLPFSYDEVIRYGGCTFMRRAVHERLTLLDRGEVVSAFDDTTSRVGLKLDAQCLRELVNASYGHPYMVQLLGYHLVDIINDRDDSDLRPVGLDDVRLAVGRAVEAYSSRALRPMVAELSATDYAYLAGMAQCLDKRRFARSSDVARVLGKDVKQTSPSRARLLRSGIVLSPCRGYLVFAVPYLADYVLETPNETSEIERVRAWGV